MTTRRPTPTRPPRTPPARALSDAELEECLRRLFEQTDPIPEYAKVPPELLVEFARRLPARKEAGP